MKKSIENLMNKYLEEHELKFHRRVRDKCNHVFLVDSQLNEDDVKLHKHLALLCNIMQNSRCQGDEVWYALPKDSYDRRHFMDLLTDMNQLQSETYTDYVERMSKNGATTRILFSVLMTKVEYAQGQGDDMNVSFYQETAQQLLEMCDYV